jgi:type I restriction enzyme, R subunit
MTESEWKTRKKRIDPKLKNLGWTIAQYDPNRPLNWYQNSAIEEYPTDAGPVDYALCIDGKIVGVVEAKKLSLGPQGVLPQAERYSRGLSNNPLNYDGFRVPFLYSTNGEVIWFHDVRHALNRSRQVKQFHTPDALREMFDRNFQASCQKLLSTPNDHPRLRDYQKEANRAVEEAIFNRKRQMLVVMATGTGKTFTFVNQAYRLMKSGVAKRILFLVDRRALAAQAVKSFASFEPEPGLKFNKIYEVYSQRFFRNDLGEDEGFDPNVIPTSYLTEPKPGDAFIYVSTIQRMTINLFGRDAIFNIGDEEIDEDANKLDIPIHAFDLIVADECHRGYSSAELSTWRNTLDHFDAIKIGLTATPASHSKAYFNEVVYRYEYERAVREGHLVDYDVVKISSNVRINGLFLKEGEQVGIVDPETGIHQMDLLEDEREFDTSDLERKITAPDSNQKILEEIKRYTEEYEEKYGRFPKTLIFAVNDLPHTSHADSLVNIARDIFGRGDSFVQKITGRVDRPLQKIREFRNRPLPGIVVSVDMLTTGVDIPDLEFIVFLRLVQSRILFEQMLGRGTRKGEKLPDKSHFTVFDCFDGTLLEFFKKTTAITAEAPEKQTKTIKQVIEEIWQNKDRDYNIRCLVKRMQRIDKEMSGESRDKFADYIPDGDLANYAQQLPNNLKKEFTSTMKLLRDPGFQDLLVNYTRPPRTFFIAYDVEDTVTSEWLARGADGKEYKPEDYLVAFARFVKENPSEIEAIRILLNRPQDWNTQAISELRQKIVSTPERFTLQQLQKAHELHYHKALVDIISMIKHAAREDEPLFTAEERVNRAFERVVADLQLVDEQQKWLDRIRNHMIENLSIDQEDFDDLPIFNRFGGWTKANRVFNGQLDQIIKHINEAIAA